MLTPKNLTLDDLKEYEDYAEQIATPHRLIDWDVVTPKIKLWLAQEFYSLEDQPVYADVVRVEPEWDNTGYYSCLYRLWFNLFYINDDLKAIRLKDESFQLDIVEVSWEQAQDKDPTLVDKFIEEETDGKTYRGLSRGNE